MADPTVVSMLAAQISLRTTVAADAVSLHPSVAPTRLPDIFPTRPSVFAGHGVYQGPLSQWQVAADMYIDSDIRKRGRLVPLSPAEK